MADVFQVLAHCDYPRRSWPTSRVGEYREADYEEEYRTVFRALATSGRALELNTSSPLASATLMRWWYEEGGDAVSFGSVSAVGSGFVAGLVYAIAKQNQSKIDKAKQAAQNGYQLREKA